MSLEIDGYTIQKALGSGGMSTVYLATQDSLGRSCALKVMSSALTKGDSFTNRFKLEGKTIAKLQHSNIVNIYDIATQDDCCYIAMEYLPGATLHERLHTDLSLREVLSIIKQVARALGFAHEHNIIHRDIKPANIMFRRDGSVVLTDFGIAKHLSDETAALTGTGSLIGTPAYMSPEQISVGALTGRSDLYSLGVVFYEMLIGVQPYLASNPIAVAFMHVNTPIPTLPAPIGFLQDLLNKVLAKESAERFQNAADLIAAIDKIEREHDTERIMLLHSHNSSAVNAVLPANPAARQPLLSQYPDTKLITILENSQPAAKTTTTASTAARNTRKWFVLATLIGALALAGNSYLDYRSAQRALTFTRLLEVAGRQLEQQRIVSPESDNLYTTLNKLQQLAANDERTDRMTQSFTEQITLQARRAQAHGSFESSLALVDKGLQLAANNERLQDLRNQVNAQHRQRQKELRQQQQEQAITRLLALAQAQIEAEQLTEPDGDNAVNSLRQVLALAPNQEQALASLDAIAERYAERASTTLSDKNEELAADIIRQGLAISATNRTLLSQQQALQARVAQRQQAEQSRLERQNKIEALLAIAKTQLAEGKLVSPEGANANTSFQSALQLDADNKQARAGLRRIATALATKAKARVAEDEFATALLDVQTALAILPDDKPLLQLQQEIVARQEQTERLQRERQNTISQLLQLAASQIDQGKLNAPPNDNAVHNLEKVLMLVPDQPQALEGMQQVANAFESLAREQLAQGADQRSNRYADAGLRIAANHNGLLAVKRELLERGREQALRDNTERDARDQQIDKLLEMAAQQVKRQQFTAPDSDNAYATWRAILTLEPDNRTAKRALAQLPGKILGLATAELDTGGVARGHQVLQQGLQVWPNNAGLRALEKRVATAKIKQRRTQDIAKLLQKSEQQLREGRVFSPEKNNAVSSLQQALELDADNAEARTALTGVIEAHLNSATEALQRDQYEQAESLLSDVANVQPKNARLATLQARLAVRRHIASLLEEAQTLATQQRFTLPAQNNALVNYRKVLRLDPIHKQASDAVANLRQTIFNGVKAALKSRDWAQSTALIDQGLTLLPGDKRLLATNVAMLEAQTGMARQRKQQASDQRIERLVSVARNQMSRRQLSAPAGDNAVATMQQILLLDPNNRDATQIKADIATRYVTLIKEALQVEDQARAQIYLERGLRVAPKDAALNTSKKQLQAQQQQRAAELLAQEKAEAARLTRSEAEAPKRAVEPKNRSPSEAQVNRQPTKKVDEIQLAALLAQAKQQREDKNLITPAGDSALASYRQALQLDPQSKAAKQGISAIKRYYRELIEAHRKAQDIPLAAAWVETMREQFPADTAFKTLQQSLLKIDYRDTLRDGDRGPALVYAPAASFIMGDKADTGSPNERPPHKEIVPKGFMLGQLEVTFEEYDNYVSASGAPSPSDQGWGRGARPVINITWREAQEYLAWLSEQTGEQYRLPNEVEWEYAARAGTDSDYWWGENIGTENANCKDCDSEYGGKRSAPVGSFDANAFGLFDTAGNVHEWASSPYSASYPADGSTLRGLGTNAIARGGSWYDSARFSRAATRVVLNPDFKNFFVGFRVLRSLPTPTKNPQTEVSSR